MLENIKNNFKENVIFIFNKFKRKSINDLLLSIPVYSQSGRVICFLVPITFDFQQTMPSIIELITLWKLQNPTISNSIMDITSKMTKEWIKKYVLQIQDKVIFMIKDINNKYLGYIGYASFDWEGQQCQIDSVLRGIKNVIPRLMEYCVKRLIQFGFEQLNLKNIALTTDSVNTHAINFYQNIGFKEIYRIPMELIEINQKQKRWVKNYKMGSSQKYSVKMIYDRGMKNE